MSWRSVLVLSGSSIVEAMRNLDGSKFAVVCVVDKNEILLGTVTDGDVRRGLLRGIQLTEPIDRVMNSNPITLPPDTNQNAVQKALTEFDVKQVPLVDKAGRIVGLEIGRELHERQAHTSPVVIMAGGLGTRLLPLTENCPKPLLRVGSKPLLETILERFIACGFRRFYFSVNYKADMIEDHFGNGEKWGVAIEYLREEKLLGTAGPLSLLPSDLQHPFIVMNGDVLTKVDFNRLLDFHIEQGAFATMCVREVDVQFPYGVASLNGNGHAISGFEEKPVHRFLANAGIYVFDPKVRNLIPTDQSFNMDTLLGKLLAEKQQFNAFPLREYWLDIGKMDDYQRAEFDFEEVFKI